MHHATTADIVRRLTGPYKMTAETALGWGMGDADHIREALDEAIDDDLVAVASIRNTTYGKGIRFVTLAANISYCQTCIDGCLHGRDAEPGSCGHRGCWGPDSTSDCMGIAYARKHID
jgi:hypothetical protein